MSNRLTAAQVWRQRARDKRALSAVLVTLPSGAEVKLARPPIESWFGTGRMPEQLSADIVKVFGGEQTEESYSKTLKEIGDQRAGEVVKFLNRIVQESVLEPRVTLSDDPGDDEMAMADIDDEDKAWIMASVLEGLPQQAVSFKGGGEASTEQLADFPENPRRPNARKDVRKVRA